MVAYVVYGTKPWLLITPIQSLSSLLLLLPLPFWACLCWLMCPRGTRHKWEEGGTKIQSHLLSGLVRAGSREEWNLMLLQLRSRCLHTASHGQVALLRPRLYSSQMQSLCLNQSQTIFYLKKKSNRSHTDPAPCDELTKGRWRVGPSCPTRPLGVWLCLI